MFKSIFYYNKKKIVLSLLTKIFIIPFRVSPFSFMTLPIYIRRGNLLGLQVHF